MLNNLLNPNNSNTLNSNDLSKKNSNTNIFNDKLANNVNNTNQQAHSIMNQVLGN